ncbi:MAG: hypothetical protein R3F56_10235 [Planctomycetota bacterium]
MLTVTYVGTDHHNPGDTITDLGVRALVSAMFGVHHATQVMLRDDVDVSRYVLAPSDILVVSGTPWLWDGFRDAPKARHLAALLARDRSSLRLALGIGSCYLPGATPPANTAAGIEHLFGAFDAVVCRDALAYELCRPVLGARAHLRACPSVHAAAALGIEGRAREELALVYVDPLHCFGSDYVPADVQRQVAQKQVELLRQGAHAVCMTAVDARSFRARFGEPHCADRSPRAILRTLAKYRRVVSGRVHGAVPARALGAEVEIFPLDSRVLTATLVGCRPIDLGHDLGFGQAGELAAVRAAPTDVATVARDLRASLGARVADLAEVGA